MSDLIRMDDSYAAWIKDISSRFRSSQLSAAVKVNTEMLRFYWLLGKELDERKNRYSWGSHFYDQISKDIQKAIPDSRSFSVRNLQYMHQFYLTFKAFEIVNQAGSQLLTAEITNHLGSQMENVFLIPWGHLKVIMSRCRNDTEKALFFVNKVL